MKHFKHWYISQKTHEKLTSRRVSQQHFGYRVVKEVKKIKVRELGERIGIRKMLLTQSMFWYTNFYVF